jgi:hypothetical protein
MIGRFYLHVITAVGISLSVGAQTIPKGFVVPKCSISPDGRLGVTVPLFAEHDDSENPKNSVIELKTGKTLAAINTKFTGWDRMNHGGVLPCRWSADSSLLLWTVDGKWFPHAVVLLKFKNGVLEWQRDVTAIAEAETLKRTKKAAPDKYAKARKANTGSGSAYPEGFSIYVAVLDQISFPLHVRATLTADPKEIEGFPKLESNLTGTIDQEGRFTVTDFHVGSGYWREFVDTITGVESCNFDELYQNSDAN